LQHFLSLQLDVSQPTFRVQKPWNAQLTVGNIKCIVEVLNMARRLQGIEVDEVWAVGMNQSIESKTTPP
jgi:hypothetical protein